MENIKRMRKNGPLSGNTNMPKNIGLARMRFLANICGIPYVIIYTSDKVRSFEPGLVLLWKAREFKGITDKANK